MKTIVFIYIILILLRKFNKLASKAQTLTEIFRQKKKKIRSKQAEAENLEGTCRTIN